MGSSLTSQNPPPVLSARPIPITLSRVSNPEPCASCGVRHISVCNAIDSEHMARLAELAVTEEFTPGQNFIQEDDPATAFFNVVAGTVRLFKLLPDGRRQITGFAGPGHFLGLAASPHYAFSAEAVDEVQACRFSRPKLYRLLQDFPALEKRLLEVAAIELAAAHEQMLLLGRKTARERLASFLWGLATTGRPCAPPTTKLHLPMTRSDIADYLGLTIETVSRTVTALKSQRLIGLHGPAEIELLDLPRLRALAGAEA